MQKLIKKNIGDIFTLAPMQEAMLFHYLKSPHSEFYFEQLSLGISGKIDLNWFEKAWNAVIDTNEILRTVIYWEKLEKPFQIVLKEKQPLNWSYYDFSSRNPNDAYKAVDEIKRRDRIEKFDLYKLEVPFRIILCKISADKYELIISNHHILYDGWSTGIILAEFLKAYDAFSQGQGWLKPVKPKFKEFVKEVLNRDLTGQKKYWQTYLSGFDTPAIFSIKNKISPAAQETDCSGHYEFSLTRAKLEDFVKSHKMTLASLLYGAWGILLSKYNNSRDIIFGTTVSGRSGLQRGIETCAGMFINTVPLRITKTGESITAFLEKLAQDLRERENFETFSLPEIKNLSELKSHEELFDTIMVVENYPLEKSLLENTGHKLTVEKFSMFERTHYDFTIIINVFAELKVHFYYNQELFSADAVQQLAGHFQYIIDTLVTTPYEELAKLNDIDILSEEEKKRLLEDFNALETFYPADKCLHQLFEEQVQKTPDNMAVFGHGQTRTNTDKNVETLRATSLPTTTQISYRQLNEQADRLAGLLIEKGIQSGSIVAIMMERSLEMITGIFGILKSGGAYLPIDPHYPQERIDYIIKDSHAAILIDHEEKIIVNGQLSMVNCQRSMSERILRGLQHSAFDLPRIQHSNHLCYIIYTSGTTGKPKGAAVEHRSVVNTLWALQEAYPLKENDTYLLKTTYTFDVSVAELFGWFLGNGRLAILEPGGEKDAHRILKNIAQFRITHINFVPAMFNVFLDYLQPGNISQTQSLKYIFLAGEALLPSLVVKFKNLGLPAGIALENIYGPTEASIYASRYSLKDWHGEDHVPIGIPLANVKLYILGIDGFLQPIGVAGELVIGGAGIARGYLNRPELTTERFIVPSATRNPFEKGFLDFPKLLTNHHSPFTTHHSPIYKTGDLARWRLDGPPAGGATKGIIEFLGRIDQQVKIRGFRIELKEIESRLMEYTGLKEAVVTVWEDSTGDKQLAAYFVPSATAPAAEKDLPKFLAAKLPGYMIPSYFIPLDKLPLTASGKLDRKALPLPSESAAAKTKYVAPRTDIEIKLAAIWADILGIPRETIGIDDHFFERGGHSLKATGLSGRIHKTFDIRFPLAKLFDIPTIRGQANYINDMAGLEAQRFQGFRPLEPTEKKEYYALSPSQKRLFILHQMENTTGHAAYNMTGLLHLEGPLAYDRFVHAFHKLIERHESLRTSFEILADEPVQRVHDHVAFEIYNSLATDKLPQHGQTRTLIDLGDRQKNGWQTPPFDLSKAPLLRVSLLKLETDKHILAMDMHHIIADGTSLEILSRDFMTIFNGSEPIPLRIQYRDYSQWLNHELSNETLKKQAAYWRNQFSGEIPILNLPLDFPRPAEQSFAGNTLRFEIDAAEVKSLTAFSLQENVTRAMVLLAVFNVMLTRLSNQEEIITGTPVAGRRHPDLQPVLGMFVNTLAILNEPRLEKTFTAFLMEVKERTLSAYENQEYPFESLVELLEIRRDAGRNPLFDVMFAYQNMDSEPLKLDGLTVTPYDYERQTAKFDLYLEGVEKGDTLSFSLEYSTNLFQAETARRFIDYFLNTLRNILNAPGLSLAQIPVISEEEKLAILSWSWGPGDLLDRDETIHLLFEEKIETMATAASAQTALVFKGQDMSYRYLNGAANQLARKLRTRGVVPGTVVGLMAERSFELIIGMLAILKAGGAYLPIDPEFPEQRKKMMPADAAVKLVLVTGNQENPREIEYLDICDESIYTGDDSNLPYISKGSDLLYVIYTSGSTGIPKGVMLEHRNLVNLLHFQYRYTDIDFSSVLQFTTISFDVSFQEIFSTLIAGGKLFLIVEELRKNIPELFAFAADNKIRTLFLPTSFLKFVLNEKDYVEKLPPVKHIVTAGEQLVVNDRCREYLKKHHIYLHNHYGPSEAHVVTALTLNPQDRIPDRPSIGQPLANTGIYIMAKSGHLMPINAAGELIIAGVQVGRGYLNRVELTSEKFGPQITPIKNKINKSFFGGSRGAAFSKKAPLVYRTGDLARWLSDGSIEFLGRIDHQVKIRGFRIELGEIESRLLNHEAVKEAAVIDFDSPAGEKALCAYVVLNENRENFKEELRQYLMDKLPAYMVPASFTVLEAIPLLPNKKVDRKALPKPGWQEIYDRYEGPRTTLEKNLVNTWAELLGIKPDTISIDDDFFHLGGHSLKAALMTSRLHRLLHLKIPLTQIFKTPTIRGLAAYIQGTDVNVQYQDILPIEKKDYYPVSSAQKRLYLLQQMPGMGGGYNLYGVFRVTGALDKKRLEETFQQMTDRHESFRTYFTMISNETAEPVQRIHGKVKLAVLAVKGQEERAGEALIKSFIRPFDLSQAPLLRVSLIEEEGGTHILVVDMHHIIADGMSLAVFVREFMAFYKGETLPSLELQYKDFTSWQNSTKQNELLVKQGAYWRRHLGEGTELPELNLPLDYPRPLPRRFEGATIHFELGEDDFHGLNRLASEQELTSYMVLLAVFYIFAAKISGQEDIVVGSPVAGRRHADLENMIGMFVNTLALRNYPVPDKTLHTFLMEIKAGTLAAFENQDYLFEDLVTDMAVRWDTGRNPLFDVLFSFQDLDIPAIEIPGLTLSEVFCDQKQAKFDLSLLAQAKADRLAFRLEYSTRLFNADTALRFTRYFKQAARAIIGNLDLRLGDIEIISETEKEQILHDFNDTETDYPREKSIHQLFTEQALRTSDHVAVFSHGQTRTNTDKNVETLRATSLHITYSQLNKQSDHLAGLLIAKGILPGDIIAIMGGRSLEMVKGILGILKAGAAYLPIDNDYPQERVNYMLRESAAILLIDSEKEIIVNGQLSMVNCQRSMSERTLRGLQHSAFDLPRIQHSNHLCYIIYTSGSTGKPKGVMVTHRNVVRLVKNTNYASFGPGTCILQTGAPVFDATTFEIWGALLNGGRLVLTSKETILDAARLGRMLKKHRVNTLWLSAPLFNQLLQQDIEMFSPLHYLIVGGDVLSPEHIHKVRHRFPRLQVTNGYGPTENTTFSVTHLITADYQNIPIGRPIANSTAYIVDKNHHLLPVGIYGELVVGGDGVAWGYMNNPELSANKFGPQITLITQIKNKINKSFFGGSRGAAFSKKAPLFYKTGDLARWLPDGTIEYLGRIDKQVKIRGFRIELNEIENQLLSIPGIKETIILVKNNAGGEKYLCAYIVADQIFEPALLRKILAEKLPDYMIPAYFIFLDKMPLNTNGKIDRHALPEPGVIEEDYQAPVDDVEKQLAVIWSEILGIDKNRIGSHTNFFHCGGHSLKAGQVIAHIAGQFHVHIPLAEIFSKPVLAELAAFIKTAVKGVFTSIPKAPVNAYYPVSSAQKRLYVLQQMDEKGIYYNMPVFLVLEEIDNAVDKKKIENVFQELIQRHESLRTSFEMKGTEPVQIVHEHAALELDPGWTPASFIRPFNLAQAPLMRIGLAPVEKNKYLLMIDIHHIIADGVSMGIMMQEFTRLYAGKNPAPLNLHYKDYCHWKSAADKKQELQKEYWLKQFQGDVPRLKLPLDFERPPVPSFAGSSVSFELDTDVTGALQQLAQEEDVTLYMVLKAVIDIFLARISGQEEVLTGTVAAGREHPDLESIIGMFVNTLALRSFPAPGKTFREFLQEIKTGTLEAFANQDYPFEELVEHLGLARNNAQNPLFDVMFSLDSLNLHSLDIPGLKISPYPYESSSAKFDLTIMVHVGDTIIFTLEYRAELFRQEKIARFPGYINDIIARVLENRNIRLEAISLSVDLARAKEKELETTFNF